MLDILMHIQKSEIAAERLDKDCGVVELSRLKGATPMTVYRQRVSLKNQTDRQTDKQAADR